jgi:hypothetical protein
MPVSVYSLQNQTIVRLIRKRYILISVYGNNCVSNIKVVVFHCGSETEETVKYVRKLSLWMSKYLLSDLVYNTGNAFERFLASKSCYGFIDK